MPGLEGYSKKVQKLLGKKGIRIGDRVSAGGYEGMLMPRIGGDANALVIKLDNGYNIGVRAENARKLAGKAKMQEREWKLKSQRDPAKPTIAILHTGGTIASKLDYRTGAVEPAITDDELLAMYPELMELANVRSRIVFQIFSEDLEPAHWETIAKKAYDEIAEEGCDGVIITHGTDTMYYTASALSFALQNLPVPVLLVASQRSSDRPSSDAGVNLLSAALFIAKGDYAGVGICMHSSPSDDKCWILEANRCRKMHTSRRDAYRPINSKPLAEIDWNARSINFLKEDYRRRDQKRILQLKAKFSDKVGLLKIYPGFPPDLIDFFAKKYQGLLIEGYAFGQMPVNAVDSKTDHHKILLGKIAALAKNIPIVVASQVPYGIANMNVYSTSRDLTKAGVIEARMPAYSAYVKLCWLLGNGKRLDDIRKKINEDIAGEVVTRQELDEFPDEGLEKG
ncbi:MAG: Glu-tRNA(Gln) amidotransferase subunit GatD [Candidatus Aenigmarchaeota archaeon]|nr:Glu-tRNA(Gln) amidotransferase subunit GatD [Candidatus Aenigmarchaeota archaeon]